MLAWLAICVEARRLPVGNAGIHGKVAAARPHEPARYDPREGVGFLQDIGQYPDLRQDTLRNVQVIDGEPYVQIELRDLEDATMEKVRDALIEDTKAK